jgi:hypothetical protein
MHDIEHDCRSPIAWIAFTNLHDGVQPRERLRLALALWSI